MFLTALVEKIVHKFGGHYHGIEEEEGHQHEHNHHTTNLGIMSAIAVAIHNLPEGLAVYTTGLKGYGLGYTHSHRGYFTQYPLSIAITMPIFYATGSRKRDFYIH